MSIPKRKKAVNRSYRSPLREDQASATRNAIIEAAAREFSARSYADTSIDAIAKSAGVSRATVFNAFGGKPALLKAAFELSFARAAGGGNEPQPLVTRPKSIEVRSAKGVQEYTRGYARLATDICRVLAPIYVTMRAAAQGEPEVASLLEATNAVRRRGALTIVNDIRSRAPIRPDLTDEEAADIVWVLNDPGVYFQLVHERGWTPERFAIWLADALERQLLR